MAGPIETLESPWPPLATHMPVFIQLPPSNKTNKSPDFETLNPQHNQLQKEANNDASAFGAQGRPQEDDQPEHSHAAQTGEDQGCNVQPLEVRSSSSASSAAEGNGCQGQIWSHEQNGGKHEEDHEQIEQGELLIRFHVSGTYREIYEAARNEADEVEDESRHGETKRVPPMDPASNERRGGIFYF